MKIEVDMDKEIENFSNRRIELMKHLCEQITTEEITLRIVNELRYLTGVINNLEKLKNDGRKQHNNRI